MSADPTALAALVHGDPSPHISRREVDAAAEVAAIRSNFAATRPYDPAIYDDQHDFAVHLADHYRERSSAGETMVHEARRALTDALPHLTDGERPWVQMIIGTDRYRFIAAGHKTVHAVRYTDLHQDDGRLRGALAICGATVKPSDVFHRNGIEVSFTRTMTLANSDPRRSRCITCIGHVSIYPEWAS